MELIQTFVLKLYFSLIASYSKFGKKFCALSHLILTTETDGQ